MQRKPRIVVLGMMAKCPVPGVIWQTMHYLEGFRRLGFNVHYAEAHAGTPSMLMQSSQDDSADLAARFIDETMRRFGMAGQWSFQALHGDGRCHGTSERKLRRLLGGAELVINLHGGTTPRPEHFAGDRLVYVETDPVRLQLELHDDNPRTREILSQHSAFFTFAENLGREGCDLPVPTEFDFMPTRQPVVLDFWDHQPPGPTGAFTSVGNWHQAGRDVTYAGQNFSWSKDAQWREFLHLPRRTGQRFELALSGVQPHNVEVLEQHGWNVRPALEFGVGTDSYREFLASSRAEFTVAKEQNVRFKTGWFSDRSATYLAAGRPVVTEDTGFGTVLPVGEGLFSVSSLDEAVAAVETVNGDYERQRAGARAIARELFDSDRVLTQMLDHCDVRPAKASRGMFDRWRRPHLEAPVAADSAVRPSSPLHPDSTVLAIIPHFKCEEWLEDCLASLTEQTRPLDGIVVIDDASEEPPIDIVRKFPTVTLLHAERNVGPYRLVQQIIEETDYDAYMFQDADDWSAPERLEVLLRAAGETGAELLGAQEIRVFCDEPEVTPIAWPLDVAGEFAAKPTAFPLLHPTSIVARDLVMRLGGFASGLRFSGDAEFLRRARFVTEVINVPEHLYFRRIRRHSLTTAPETGLQSPERKRVMEMLWARARHNAELVELGAQPHLEPWEQQKPVGLAKRTGPPLRGRGSQPAPPRPEPPAAAVPAQAGGAAPRPVFVVGADRSGVSALAFAIGQHPAFTVVTDEMWLGKLDAGAVGGAAGFAAAASRLAAGDAARWVDGSPQNTFAIDLLADAFEDALFIHVVRDVDAAVGAMVDPLLGSAGATGGTQVPARLRVKFDEAQAIDQWLAANRACAQSGHSLGADRMIRVDFDAIVATPETMLRTCLEFVGVDYADACLRPLRGVRARGAHPLHGLASPDPATAAAREEARVLSRELIGRPLSSYEQILASSRATTRQVLAERLDAAASVAIVSRGDDELLRAAEGHAQHFPADESGRWIGYHPRDSREAIDHIDAALRAGTSHIFFPWTSRWWLDHYRDLGEYLSRSHSLISDDPELGALFALDRNAAAASIQPVGPASARNPGRLVMVTDHFPKFSETFFAREFAELRDRGWDVHILCNRSNKDQWRYFPELRDELEQKTRIHVISDFAEQLSALAPEIVHFGYGTLARQHAQTARRLGCKVVTSLRGYDINYFGLDDPHCYDEMWGAVDMLHVVSQDIWQRAVRRGCPPEMPHRVIRDAVDVSAFEAPARSPEKVGTSARPLRVVSVGRLHWKKGYEHALAAIRAVLDHGVDVRYRIIGDGPDREAVLFAIHDLALESHVELLGACEADVVKDTMAWADLSVQASVSEGFCVSVIEAQAMALPIVCTDADGLGENVADGESGFVVARRDPNAIADRVLDLTRDPALRIRMGAAARQRALRHFDVGRQLDGLEALYRTLVSPDKPASHTAENPEQMTVAELQNALVAAKQRMADLERHLRRVGSHEFEQPRSGGSDPVAETLVG
ncbi:MAG TPA: glycosyltransferase [Baekduia sp.]|nr:glycosyltransferase [Baekduia sp.]